MSRTVRTVLWSHSLASWAAFGVLWADALRQPNRGPTDGEFWLIFLLTEGLAPLWLPLSIIIYRPDLGYDPALTMIVAVYVPVAGLTAVWRGRCERRQLRASRRAAGRCVECGYDLRETPARCPECGAAAQPPNDPPAQRAGAAA